MDSPTPLAVRNFRLPDKFGASAMTIALGAGGVILFIKYLDTLVELAENTIYLGAMVLGGFFVLSTLWQSREAIWYWQQNQIRKFRRAVIGEDPIGILDSVIRRLQRKIEEIQESMAQAAAALNQQLDAIKQLRREGENEARLARQAQSSSIVQMKQHALASERNIKAADELQPDAEKMAAMQSRYGEALELAQANVRDAESQKRVMALKVRSTEAKRKAFAAFKTLFGQSAEWQMYGDAIEIIEQRSYEAEAQIDQLLVSVEPQIATQKLQAEADAESALARLGLGSAPTRQLTEAVVEGQIITSTSQKETVRR